MNINYFKFSVLFFMIQSIGFSQVTEVFDDFEGNSNITSWFGDDCEFDLNFDNPYQEGINTSNKVLLYQDIGGQYANVRFDVNGNFDLSSNQTFSLKIFIQSNGSTGNQPNQVSLKLQDGLLTEPWVTQSEIIKPVMVDQWQTVTFDFKRDNYLNLDSSSLPPTLRNDFNRIVIQVNGENNSDHVLAYLDDINLYETVDEESVFNELVWSDEFDIDGGLDTSKWHHQTIIPQGDSWFNGEIQHYTDRIDNAFIKDGILNIVAKRESYTNQGVTKQFTSARLNSKFAFTHGKVEVRAKLPFGLGTWPAIWMLGKNITETGSYWQTQGYGTTGWPACGEIDIMEHWGSNQDYVSSAIHTPSSFGATVNHGGQNLLNASTEFHLYSLEWSENEMIFSVDGNVHYTYNPAVKNEETWPFDLDQFVLFNVAILPSIETSFTESALEIDYIRIYQKGNISKVKGNNQNAKLIYPNPFNQEIYVQVESANNGKATVQLFDLNGHQVFSNNVDVKHGWLTIELLDDLPKGIYILQYTIDGQSYSNKLIKL